jgi:SAM-dependent methyltransferase
LLRHPGAADLAQVTSDCRPWASAMRIGCCAQCGTVQKIVDAAWHAEAARVYADYALFFQGDGDDQAIFVPGRSEPAPRARLILEHLLTLVDLPDEGRILDIGCGTGAALGRFSDVRPRWRLNGFDLGDRYLEKLSRIANFERLYTGDLGDAGGPYDLIIMFHSLEHIPEPVDALRRASGLLSDQGMILIQVPDLARSYFDLAVIDHRTHFTRATLAMAIAGAGLALVEGRHDVLPKELTMLARRGAPAPVETDESAGPALAGDIVAWLGELRTRARSTAATGPIGLFGTSISAMWCLGELAGDVAFLVDEDPSRIGRTLEGLPVYAPGQVPAGSTVFVPMNMPTAGNIAKRLSTNDVRYVAPG